MPLDPQTYAPEVVIIAAVAERDRLIGDGMDLPWHIPADLQRFKRLTSGHPLVMGRRTYQSILHQFGGPLPNRENIVLSHTPEEVDAFGPHVYASLEEALAAFVDRERVFIGGGASVYAQALPIADRLELTLVEGDFEGDTHFPPYEHLLGTEFELVGREAHAPAGAVPGFRFETWERKG